MSSISKYKSQTCFVAKAEGSGRVEVAMVFQRSEFDTRLAFSRMGTIDIAEGDEFQEYVRESYPEDLTDEFTKGDRPFFLGSQTGGEEPPPRSQQEYRGNVNVDLVNTLLPHDLKEPEVSQQAHRKIAFYYESLSENPTEMELKNISGFTIYMPRMSRPLWLCSTPTRKSVCSPSFLSWTSGNLKPEGNTNFKLAERLAFFFGVRF